MVSGSIIKRRSEQSVNFNSIVWLMFGIAIFYFWFWALGKTNDRSKQNAIIRETKNASFMNGSYLLTATPDNPYIVEETPTPSPSPTVEPTATPSAIPTIYTVNFVFKYSYYNPKLGGANCYTWDAAINDCISMMANGEDWHNQYGVAVACPPEIALGTIVQVTFPEALSGYWTCKDRGSLITGDYIDFLDITQRYEWNAPVSAVLYPPTVPMEQVTNGSH